MEKSANELMQEVLTSAVLDAIVAWKAASGGLPNVLARELGAVHPNTTLADLPAQVQKAIGDSTRAAFNRLLKEGYAVAKGAPQGRPTPSPRGPRPDGPRPDGPRGPRGAPRGKPAAPVVEVKPRPRSGKSR